MFEFLIVEILKHEDQKFQIMRSEKKFFSLLSCHVLFLRGFCFSWGTSFWSLCLKYLDCSWTNAKIWNNVVRNIKMNSSLPTSHPELQETAILLILTISSYFHWDKKLKLNRDVREGSNDDNDDVMNITEDVVTTDSNSFLLKAAWSNVY